tara:strand:+ start:56 stop:730 length:675 start_codon:yes stop_codon:yes gene_type:complete
MTMSKKKHKILNLYACLGGNRYKWDEVADNLEVTAVELDADLAKLYQERFPNDIVIVADAHQYLLDHYKEFDFIWSSPPCPSHSRARFWGCKNGDKTTKPVFADFRLYEEIMFLQHYFKGKYTVENVIPYYDPMIVAKKRGRHLYWTNFNLPNQLSDRDNKKFVKDNVKSLCKFHNYDFTKYKGVQRVEKIARNLVDYQAGKTILETAFGIINREDIQQMYMFP